MTKQPKRKMRGMELFQVALMLIIAVAIGLAIWYIVSGMTSTVSVPKIQVDTYNSTIVGSTVYLTLKFGTAAHVTQVSIYSPSSLQTAICSTTLDAYVSAGQSLTVELQNCGQAYTLSRLIVMVTTDSGTYKVDWIRG